MRRGDGRLDSRNGHRMNSADKQGLNEQYQDKSLEERSPLPLPARGREAS